MNQAILFSPHLMWNSDKGMVEFHAQQAGMLIHCFVSTRKLAQLSAIAELNEDNATSVFESLRFDIEELAEELIENEQFSHDGSIVID